VGESENDRFEVLPALAEVGGPVLGEVIASSSGLPPGCGAGLGAGFSIAMRYLFGETKRLFSPREKRRVLTVLALSAKAIERERAAGKQLRSDEFFNRKIDDRTTAEELGEAVIYAAYDEHEERKLPFLANLYASFGFDVHVDRAMANYLVKLGSALTYRQYCLLEIANDRHGYDLKPFGVLNRSGQENPTQVFAALAECFELYRFGLVKFSLQFGPITKVDDISLQSMELDTPMGAYLHLGMRLQEIASEDIAEVAKLLSAP